MGRGGGADYGRTDHMPLLGLLGEGKPLPVMASARVQRWAMLLSAYHYTLMYSPARLQTHCDALSRLPLPGMPNEDLVPAETAMLMEFIDSAPVNRKQIQAWTRTDPVLARVLEYTRNGWPLDIREDSSQMAPYRTRQAELSVEDDCLFWGGRIIIPTKGRSALLSLLHEGHFGMARMKAFSRAYFWWPGLDRDVEKTVAECVKCQEFFL